MIGKYKWADEDNYQGTAENNQQTPSITPLSVQSGPVAEAGDRHINTDTHNKISFATHFICTFSEDCWQLYILWNVSTIIPFLIKLNLCTDLASELWWHLLHLFIFHKRTLQNLYGNLWNNGMVKLSTWITLILFFTVKIKQTGKAFKSVLIHDELCYKVTHFTVMFRLICITCMNQQYKYGVKFSSFYALKYWIYWVINSDLEIENHPDRHVKAFVM